MNDSARKNQLHQYGLIGYPLSHSFSEKYFTEKFKILGITDSNYKLYELENLSSIREWVSETPNLRGFNVTIPFKSTIIPFLDHVDEICNSIGAVNCVKVNAGKLIGYNTDVLGFRKALYDLLRISGRTKINNALILGNGGSSKAVQWVLKHEDYPFTLVSRSKIEGTLNYQQITSDLFRKFDLIVNTTPLGMYPNVQNTPDLPYHVLNKEQMLMDLIYNPEKTLFLRHGEDKGCRSMNGMPMLIEQAEASWKIWNN